MRKLVSRRRFVTSALTGLLAAPLVARAAGRRAGKAKSAAPAVIPSAIHPAIACSTNGHPRGIEKAMAMLLAGADTLDAAVAAVNLVEDDPNEHGVGLGGHPNEEGVVELDSSCMHGPSQNAGAVASLRNIRNPSSVARDVLWHTDHVLLVGEGALRFARARGFVEENLLTEDSRRAWMEWKSKLSREDDWLEPEEKRPEKAPVPPKDRIKGTIHFSTCNAKGEVSGVTSTSGLAWKIPGRVGDSPIIGAGLYVHGKVGAAGATGRGEACILASGANTVVDGMERGLHPTDACLAAARRVVELNPMPYLWKDGKPAFNVTFYAVNVRGEVGSAGLFPATFAACDAKGPRREDCAYLYRAG